jgi:hypothetical protein
MNDGPTRRGALMGLLGGLWAVVSCSDSQRSADRRPGKAGALHQPPANSPARQLRQEFDRVGRRAYSEEGIPVFLVGENLAASRGTSAGQVLPDSPAAELASTLRESADALAQVVPNLTEADVAKLIEVLAARDFGPRRTRTNP